MKTCIGVFEDVQYSSKILINNNSALVFCAGFLSICEMFRGVVQLFNAVREQQKDMKSQLRQAGGSFRKQEKVIFTEELLFFLFAI